MSFFRILGGFICALVLTLVTNVQAERGLSVTLIHIYTRSKLPWVKLPDDKPAVEEFYEYEDLWPAESLARRNAVLNND